MSTFPNVDTVKSILKNCKIGEKNLSEKEINMLLKLKFDGDQMLSLKDRNFIIEIIGMINNYGFNKTYDYLKSKQKEKIRYNIVKKSEAFKQARRRFFLEATKTLRTVKIDSYLSCPKCKLYQVNSITEQKRSGDEGATTTNTCTNCGHIWVQ